LPADIDNFHNIVTSDLDYINIRIHLECMVTEVTEGIKISVETKFRPNHSDPANAIYLFSYKITIENCSEDTVKLLRRHWLIYDANGLIREVEGEGVVGEQPILDPGEIHEYASACDLSTDLGKMHGSYQMEKTATGEKFYVNVPEFKMVVPHRLN